MIGPLSVQPDLLLATTLGTTSSQTADRIHDVSYGYHFFLRFLFVFQFLFVWRECLVHQVPIVLTVLSFRFSGLCLMVVNATIHFHGQASPVGVWSFLRLPLNPSRENYLILRSQRWRFWMRVFKIVLRKTFFFLFSPFFTARRVGRQSKKRPNTNR